MTFRKQGEPYVDVGVSFPLSEDRARQEFAREANINRQLQRFGIQRGTVFGEQDSNLDLMTALDLVESSRRAWLRLPLAVRQKYQSWHAVQMAAESGQLAELLKPAAPDAGSSASGAGGSPSDSAADAAR